MLRRERAQLNERFRTRGILTGEFRARQLSTVQAGEIEGLFALYDDGHAHFVVWRHRAHHVRGGGEFAGCKGKRDARRRRGRGLHRGVPPVLILIHREMQN
jgi:hypothetical protein